MISSEFHHISVLPEELITGLNIQPQGHYLDLTLGGGGHSGLILNHSPAVRVTGVDRDSVAIAATQERLRAFGDRFEVIHSNFAEFQPPTQYHGIIADLGVSSVQFDQGDRGFSFRYDAPLDMRMDQTQELTAATIINHWDEKQLADIFYHYGEERYSRRIARNIVARRPIHSTLDLVDVIRGSVPKSYRNGRINPATRVFQGLRIAVNDELEALKSLIDRLPHWLLPGGRVGIISFHSLEDRIVKHQFRGSEQLRVITKKPIIPSDEELATNPRSRSAKLRFAEKINDALEEH